MRRRPDRRRFAAIVADALTLVLAVCVAVPAAITLTPAEETVVSGQYVEISGSSPSGGWVGELSDVFDRPPWLWPSAMIDGFTGPAQLQQIGETTIDLDVIQVSGPLRPKIAMGPLVRTDDAAKLLDPKDGAKVRQRAVDAVENAAVNWYVKATVLVLLLTVALVLFLAGIRIWAPMRLAARSGSHRPVADVWHAKSRRLEAGAVITVVVTLAAWLGAGLLAQQGTTESAANVRSLRDLAGAAPVKLRPAGPAEKDYTGAVIGDSRASRLGGPPVDDPDVDEKACERSSDSLADQLTRVATDDKVLNLACPSATIADGLLGKQKRSGHTLAPQVSRLLRMQDLRFVVVMVGPNDLAWSDFLRYCYGVDECDDRFTGGQFDYRLARFDRDYGDLLAALAALPKKPDIVVVGSYDVFAPGSACADTRGPQEHPGLDPTSIKLLADRNEQLNKVLATGAESYGFGFAQPRLSTLCEPVSPDLGRDIQGLEDRHPFHPTAVGMVRLASPVYAAIARAREGP